MTLDLTDKKTTSIERMADYHVEELLSKFDDAGFIPYREGLKDLQLRKTKTVSSSKGKPFFAGEQLVLSQSRPEGVTVQRLSAKLSHPTYLNTQKVIEELVGKLHRALSECIVAERRMILGDSEDDRDAYEENVANVARIMTSLSHVLVYQHATNILIPKAEVVSAALNGKEMLDERADTIEKVKKQIPNEAMSDSTTKSNLNEIDKDLQKAARLMITASDNLNDATTTFWPGKVDRIVVNPPRTVQTMNNNSSINKLQQQSRRQKLDGDKKGSSKNMKGGVGYQNMHRIRQPLGGHASSSRLLGFI